VWVGALLAGFGPACRDVRSLLRDVGRSFRNLHVREPLWFRLIAVLTLGVFLLYVVSSPQPPNGDAEAYYSVIAKLAVHAGRLTLVPMFEEFMSAGLVGEMHQAALLAMGSEMAAMAMVSVFGLAGVGVLLGLARLLGAGRRGEWFLLTVVGTSTVYMRLFYGGKVDVYAGALGLGAVYAVMLLGPKRGWGVAVLAGLLAGWAVQAKVTYLATLVPMLAVLGFWRVLAGGAGTGPTRRLRAVAATAGLMIAAGAVTFVPHVLKDAVLYDNPWLPVLGMMGESSETLSRPEAYGRKVLQIYPIAPMLGTFNMYGRLSALVLAFTPAAVFLPRPAGWGGFLRSRGVQVTTAGLLGFGLWAGVVWKTGVFIPRYLLPPLLLLAVVPAWGAEAATQRGGAILRFAVAGCLLAALAMTYNRPRTHPDDAIQYMLGLSPKAGLVSPEGRLAMRINEQARPGERVFATTLTRYCLRGDLLAGANGRGMYAELRTEPTQTERWWELVRRGYRYLLLNPRSAALGDDGRPVIIDLGGGVTLDSRHLPPELRLEVIGLEGSGGKSPPPALYGAYRLVGAGPPDASKE
jgi:hypothetical protein